MTRSRSTVSDLLREGTRKLRAAGSDSPGLDAEILLRYTLDISREQLFDLLPNAVRGSAAPEYRKLIAERARGIPVAYLTGIRAFYGYDFTVSHAVLVPRPETEFLVEYAIGWLARHGDAPKQVIDVGTGSGAIAIALALETGGIHRVVGSEVSPHALGVAARNRDHLNAAVELIEGSLLEWLDHPVDLILANLPYLRPDQAHAGIEHEPAVALFAGEDGFGLNRQLLEQAPSRLNSAGALIMELDPAQAELALQTGQRCFPHASVEIREDLAGTNRYLIIEQ